MDAWHKFSCRIDRALPISLTPFQSDPDRQAIKSKLITINHGNALHKKSSSQRAFPAPTQDAQNARVGRPSDGVNYAIGARDDAQATVFAASIMRGI